MRHALPNLPFFRSPSVPPPEFFCRSTLLYVAPPPEGHEDLYVQLLTHVLKTTKVTFGVVVVALRYFDMYTRLAADYAGVASPEAGGGPTSPPKLAGQVRFVIASLMTAAKFLDDVTYGNRSWSVVSGIPQDELTEAEIAILGILAYNLHMQVADFQQWMGRLQTITAHLEATRFARLAHAKAGPADPATAHAHAAAGQHLQVGDVIGEAGDVGFAPVPHLHMQLLQNASPKAHTVPFAFRDVSGGSYIPVAGAWYDSSGLIDMPPPPVG